MHKKIEAWDLDIPKDDIDCWERYPKHRWVYELSRVLDSQNIRWSPYEIRDLQHAMSTMQFNINNTNHVINPGTIYIKEPQGRLLYTEIFILKGEIKLMRHIETNQELAELIGEIELKLNAFVSLHFSKFTGVITTKTYNQDIMQVQLRPKSDLALTTNQELIKIAKRIYKRHDLTLTGLTDRVLHETLAS